MARLGRNGRIIKWAGAALTLAVLAVWVVSSFVVVEHRSAKVWTKIGRGMVTIAVWRTTSPLGPGWSAGLLPGPGVRPRRLLPYSHQLFHPRTLMVDADAVSIPLWMPLALIGLPTVLLFWRDRGRIPPGHCQKCGYDLTGNVSGVCPECGERI